MKNKHLIVIILLLIVFSIFVSYIPEVFANENTYAVDIDK